MAQINPTNTCPGNVLTVNSTCVPNNYTMAGSFTNSGFNSGCQTNSDRDDGWYQFVATSANITLEETSTNRRHMVAVHAACGVNPNIGCQQSTANNTNILNLTGLTVGNTYYIHLDRRSGGGGATMFGNICLYDTPDPDVAWPGMDLGTLTCTSTTTQSGNTTGATIHCGSSDSGDHTYQFTTTEITDITLDLCASSYDTEVHIFNLTAGNCDGVGLASNDDNCGVQSSLTVSCAAAGTYVVIVEGSGGAEGAYTLDITVDNCGCPTPPSNDTPCTAQQLAMDTTCNTVVGDNTLATDSGEGNPGCAAYGGEDVWYYTIIPASGEVTFQTYGQTGGITDTGIATYTGPDCSNLTQLSCNDDFGSFLYSKITETGLTPGDTIWCRVWEYGGNAFGEFQICASESVCAGSVTNDYCEDPAVLTEDPSSSFSATTSGVFTADVPSNLGSVFCGSIENNSWYLFTADATTEVFDITNVFNCGSGGIQAEVYSMGTFQCCASYTSVSNCFNPGTVSTGTVTATGLTVGQSYLLMIDGFGGAGCDFTISGWSATNVLPVTLFEFDGKRKPDHNLLTWATKSEADSKWFIIERSLNGEDYEEVGRIDAAGNSVSQRDYEFVDTDVYHRLVYYRLKMVDIDMTSEYSHVVSIHRDVNEIHVQPNPTTGQITIVLSENLKGNYQYTITDIVGRRVSDASTISSFEAQHTTNVMSDLPAGIYFLELRDLNGNLVESEKIVKE